jgi:catechol 2,3-dioxygenase
MKPTYTTKLGHAHLKVRDLQRSVDFYTKFLGLAITETVDDHYAFLTTNDLHHEIALQKVAADAAQPGRYDVGLYHVAFEVKNKRAFAEAYQTLTNAGVQVGPVDHHISWAMYFKDPDGNGIEIYCDTRGEKDGATLWKGINVELSHDKIMKSLLSV